MLTDNALVIGDHNWQDHVQEVTEVDGKPMKKGLVPRNYETHPVGFYSAVPSLTGLKLIPREEWIPRIQEQEANKSSLQHIRRANGPNGGHIPSLDQNSQGYCWDYSAHICVMLWRAVMGLPYKRLSAHAVGCIIKNFKDEGGWGALSADFIAKNGCADVSMWPEKSMSRSNDTPELRQKMLAYKVDGEWRDLQASEYDANFSEEQVMTLLLSNIPVQGDFNWWSHSVGLMRAVLNMRPTEATNERNRRRLAVDLRSLDFSNEADYAVYADVIGKLGLNSWTDSYGDLGEFVLTGNKAKLNGGVAVGVPLAA
jgi:hypothetical protein